MFKNKKAWFIVGVVLTIIFGISFYVSLYITAELNNSALNVFITYVNSILFLFGMLLMDSFIDEGKEIIYNIKERRLDRKREKYFKKK